MEQYYVPSLESWLEYEPKYEVIKENMQNLQAVQGNSDVCLAETMKGTGLCIFIFLRYLSKKSAAVWCNTFFVLQQPSTVGQHAALVC